MVRWFSSMDQITIAKLSIISTAPCNTMLMVALVRGMVLLMETSYPIPQKLMPVTLFGLKERVVSSILSPYQPTVKFLHGAVVMMDSLAMVI